MSVFYPFIFIFGLVFGSFYNVCIYRLESGESIAKGRSHCQSCKHTLSFLDRVPVISYLSLKGKCRYCSNKISMRYPMVELLTGCLFLLTFYLFGFTWNTLVYLVVVSTAIITAFIDYDTMLIRDRLILVFALCGIALILLHPETMIPCLIGLFSISVPLFILAFITKGIGYGDVKLLAVSGLILGWQSNLIAFLIGIISASLVALPQLITKKKQGKDEMPLGPFLCIGIVIALFFGNYIFNWYLGMF